MTDINTFLGAVTGSEGDLSSAGNWSLGHAPTAGEILYFANLATPLTAGLDLSAVALAGVVIEQSFTGYLPAHTYLKLNTPTLEIGRSSSMVASNPAGSPRLLIDLGAATACVATVLNTAARSTDTYYPPVRIKAANAASELHVRRGFVGLACDSPSETSTVAKVSASYVESVDGDAKLLLGPGVTMTTLAVTGGSIVAQCPVGTGTQYAGRLEITGAGGFTTLTVEGGVLLAGGSGTMGTLYANGGQVDLTRSSVARTLTHLYIGGSKELELLIDESLLTVTTRHAIARPVRMRVSAA